MQINFEHAHLHAAGQKVLADRALHVSQTKGDGLGYNVPGCNKRLDASGKERFIEVKTTSIGKETPFFISRNEVEFLFEFRKSPRLFDLSGPVERNCLLNPTSFVGRFS